MGDYTAAEKEAKDILEALDNVKLLDQEDASQLKTSILSKMAEIK
jgi:hypothetical protein